MFREWPAKRPVPTSLLPANVINPRWSGPVEHTAGHKKNEQIQDDRLYLLCVSDEDNCQWTRLWPIGSVGRSKRDTRQLPWGIFWDLRSRKHPSPMSKDHISLFQQHLMASNLFSTLFWVQALCHDVSKCSGVINLFVCWSLLRVCWILKWIHFECSTPFSNPQLLKAIFF